MFDVWLSSDHWTGPNLSYGFPPADNFTLSLGGGFTGTGPTVKIVENGVNASVAAEIDGNASIDFRVALHDSTCLTADDLIL